MQKQMMDSNQPSGNKRQFSYIIKFILLIFVSYFMVQISIVAKEIEEKRPIPGLQTTVELADEYMKGEYKKDWGILGSDVIYPDGFIFSYHYLELSSAIGVLTVRSALGDDYFLEQRCKKKGDNIISIYGFYKKDLYINVTGSYKGNYISYYIEYKNGRYVPNPQMEQETGFTTEEIVEQVDKMRTAFEEEMAKMHQYQIGRAKERRKKFTNFGFIVFLAFILACLYLKWIRINRRADIEDKYPEEVLKETMVQEREKLFKRKYLLSGCGMAFWIYILKSVVSEFILLPLKGDIKEYAAYGISAVITAVIFGLLWQSPAGQKSDRTDPGNKLLKSVFQFLSGCMATLIIVQLGIVLVPRFYTFEWRFFKINLIADGIAFFVFIMIEAAKRPAAGIDHDDMVEKGV